MQHAVRRALGIDPWPVRVAPDAPSELDEQQLGIIAVTLALRFPEWILRRVEQAAYIDDATLRWKVSVTMRWPDPETFPEEARPEEGQRVFVPLAVHAKAPMTQLDVRDQSEDSLMVLPTELNSRLASTGMLATIWSLALEERLGAPPSDRIVDVIDAITSAEPARAREILRTELDRELGAILRTPDEYKALLLELVENFLLLVPVEYGANDVRVLKYAYSSPLPWAPSLRNLASRVGWADHEVSLLRLPLGRSRSYHLDVGAPDEVLLAAARLTGQYVVDESGHDPGLGGGEFDEVAIELDSDGGSPHVDLHASRPARALLATTRSGEAPYEPNDPVKAAAAARPTAVQRSDMGFATVRFRADPSGVFGALAFTSVVNVALLFWAKAHLSQLDGQIAAAVLLTVPVVVVGYLVRPGEHQFLTRLLFGVRMLSLGLALCGFFVATLVAQGLVLERPALRISYECEATSRLRGTPEGRFTELEQLSCLPSTLGDQAAPALRQGVKRKVAIAAWIATALAAIIVIGWLRTRFAKVARRPQENDGELDDLLEGG